MMKFFHIAVLVAFFLPLSGCDGQTSEGKIHESAALNKSSSKQSPNWDDLSDTLPPERLAKLHKEAEAGDAFAQQELGFYYDTQKDEVKAFEWTQKAAAQGWAVAQRRLAHMYALKDDVKAVEWYQKAAAQADADAQYKLGLMYDNGLYITKDSVKAAEWYQKAAVQGLAAAQSNLGTKFYYGDGVPKDSVKAVEWFQKAAVQGDADAQSKLGFMYTRGDGVPKDSVKAFEWTQKAAAQGLSYAQSTLGLMFYLGDGVKENLVRAYAWCNLAAAQGDVTAQSNRDSIEIHLTAAERNEAQQLASNWKKGDALLPANNDSSGNNTATEKTDKYSALDNPDFGRAPSKKKPIMQQTGTAFVVSSNGHAVTNYHVINGCTEVKVAGLEGVAKVITSDSVNDLALLQLPGINNNFAKFNPEPGKLRQGEDVIVFGYPLNFALSSGGNLTPGTLSALTGLGNNTNQIQITAPIQPGSSGSPVMDKKGNVMAVVSMTLDDGKMTKITGQVGQNVNFAVNGQTVKTFLDANNVPYQTGGGLFSFEKSNADIAEEARKWTVLVECWK